jgi:hypothetical protein
VRRGAPGRKCRIRRPVAWSAGQRIDRAVGDFRQDPAQERFDHQMQRMTTKLELSEDEAATLLRELDAIIREDRYFLSPRIRALTAIRDQLRSPVTREPLPPLKSYEPPSKGRYRKRR